MVEAIGTAAGQIWQYLGVKGPSSALTVKKQLKLGSEVFYAAVGWLAREDKIGLQGEGKQLRLARK